MSKLQIVTDSACDLTQEVIQSLGIEIVPLPVTFGDTTYRDMVEISREKFYDMLIASERLPSTSQATPQDYIDVIRRSLSYADEVIILTLSSGLSGTYESAELAMGMLEEEERSRVTVYDTKAASIGQGLLVIEAANRAKSGESREDIVKALEHFTSRLASVFTLNTLEYLEKGGRIGKVQAMMGTVLNVKPILQLDEAGKIAQKEKIRGRSQALARLIDIMAEDGRQLERQVVGICHARALTEAEKMAEEFRRRFLVQDVVIGEMSGTIGTHVGPGCIAIFYQR